MSDAISRIFRAGVREDAAQLPRSRALRLSCDAASGDPPSRYHVLLQGVEHFERADAGGYERTFRPLVFQIEFPDDYCRCVDGTLPFRVARSLGRLAHPNVNAAGVVCLGAKFRPGTRLRPLVHELYQIASGRNFATESPLDPHARDFFLARLAEVRALRAEPLWEVRT